MKKNVKAIQFLRPALSFFLKIILVFQCTFGMAQGDFSVQLFSLEGSSPINICYGSATEIKALIKGGTAPYVISYNIDEKLIFKTFNYKELVFDSKLNGWTGNLTSISATKDFTCKLNFGIDANNIGFASNDFISYLVSSKKSNLELSSSKTIYESDELIKVSANLSDSEKNCISITWEYRIFNSQFWELFENQSSAILETKIKNPMLLTASYDIRACLKYRNNEILYSPSFRVNIKQMDYGNDFFGAVSNAVSSFPYCNIDLKYYVITMNGEPPFELSYLVNNQFRSKVFHENEATIVNNIPQQRLFQLNEVSHEPTQYTFISIKDSKNRIFHLTQNNTFYNSFKTPNSVSPIISLNTPAKPYFCLNDLITFKSNLRSDVGMPNMKCATVEWQYKIGGNATWVIGKPSQNTNEYIETFRQSFAHSEAGNQLVMVRQVIKFSDNTESISNELTINVLGNNFEINSARPSACAGLTGSNSIQLNANFPGSPSLINWEYSTSPEFNNATPIGTGKSSTVFFQRIETSPIKKEYIRAKINPGCIADIPTFSNIQEITIYPTLPWNTPAPISSKASICDGESITLNAPITTNPNSGFRIKWYRSTNTSATSFSYIGEGQTLTDNNLACLSGSMYPYFYHYIMVNENCSTQVVSPNIQVNVHSKPNVSVSLSKLQICDGEQILVSHTNSVGQVMYIFSNQNTNYTNQSSQLSTYHTLRSSNQITNYTIVGQSINGACTTLSSPKALTVYPRPVPISIAPTSLTTCGSSEVNLNIVTPSALNNGITHIGEFKDWNTSTFTPLNGALGRLGVISNPSNTDRIVEYRVKSTSALCSTTQSQTSRITVKPNLNPGTLTADKLSVCSSSSNQVVLKVNGNNGTKLTWHKKVGANTYVQVPELLNKLTATVNITETVTYQAIAESPFCPNASTNEVTIHFVKATENNASTYSINGPSAVCDYGSNQYMIAPAMPFNTTTWSLPFVKTKYHMSTNNGLAEISWNVNFENSVDFNISATISNACGTFPLSKRVSINPLPFVDFTTPNPTIPNACANPFPLRGRPRGGIFEGNGVYKESNQYFLSAAPGSTTFVRYTAVSTKGCSSMISKNVYLPIPLSQFEHSNDLGTCTENLSQSSVSWLGDGNGSWYYSRNGQTLSATNDQWHKITQTKQSSRIEITHNAATIGNSYAFLLYAVCPGEPYMSETFTIASCGNRIGALPEGSSPDSLSYRVYPNPTSDYLYITTKDIDSSVVLSYSLANSIGTPLLSGIIQNEHSTNTLDVSYFKEGIYILSIGNDKMGYTTHKILIMR